MDFKTLVRNLLVSFIPVVAFVAADHFFSARLGEQKGMQAALIFAMAVGVVQLITIYVREQRLDKMTLLDAGLILAMGGVSLVSGNDLFFKLKPALIELVMVALLGVVAFFSPRLLLLMMGRMTKGMTLTDDHLRLMQRNAAGMFVIFLLHAGLVVYSALCLSRDAWAFISGGLFYILAGIYFVVMFAVGRIKRRRMTREPVWVRPVTRKIRKNRE